MACLLLSMDEQLFRDMEDMLSLLASRCRAVLA
jgi:hypothetical protein